MTSGPPVDTVEPDPAAREPRVDAWHDRTDLAMAALAVLFLAVYATEVLAESITGGWRTTLRIVDYAIWLVFVAEFLIRLGLARQRGRYVLRHLPDLAMLALPFLRSLRILRLIPLMRALNRWVANSLRGRLVVYGTTTAILLVFTGALAELDAERHHPGASITGFGVALWWTVVTISTVGYGDFVPVTTEGRFVAAGVMISGLMLVGAITASFATWLIDRLRVEGQADRTATHRDLLELHARLADLHNDLAEMRRLIERERAATDQGVERPARASS
jgi:voltage-gated potassium channel